MMKVIRIIIQVLTRYYHKCQIYKLVRRLPGAMQASAMHDLLEIIDIPDRQTKIRLTREIFSSFKRQLEPAYEQDICDCRNDYSTMLEKVQPNVMAPNFPVLSLSINHAVLEQKVKAKITLQTLEEEVLSIPSTSKFLLWAAVMGILLSAVANFMTINMNLGNDWMGGNELLSTCGNAFFALLLIVFEAIGLYLLMHFMPRKAGNGLGRLCGIIGAVIIVISICIIIFSRAEVGTSTMTTTNVQDLGIVE